MKLPIINSREIVPVRLIPIITANNIGRQMLAGILAHRLRASGFPLDPVYDQVEEMVDGELTTINKEKLFGRVSRDVEIYAYHLNEDKEPVRMLSTEWDEIYREICHLEPVLRKEEELIGVPDSKEATWMVESMKILPPGAFLWRDDLDKLWQAHINYYLPLPGERADSRKINFDAYVAPKYRSLVMEGFEEIMKPGTAKSSTQQESRPNVKIQESLLKMVIAMATDGYKYDPNKNKSEVVSEIKEALEKLGLPLAENTIRTHLKAAADLLPGDYNQKN